MNFSRAGTTNSEVTISGTVSCLDTTFDIDTKLLTLARRPIETKFFGETDAYRFSKVEIPIPTQGEGLQKFEMHLDGPLSRISEVEQQIDLEGEDILVLTIDPKGLLTPNMLVKGQIELIDSIGETWVIEVELKVEDKNSNGFQKLLTPGMTIATAFMLSSIWVVLGMRENKNKKQEIEQIENTTIVQLENPVELDAWGRRMDEI